MALVGGMICICVWLVRLRCTMEATVSPKLDFMYTVGSERVLRWTVRCCCGQLFTSCLRPDGCSATWVVVHVDGWSRFVCFGSFRTSRVPYDVVVLGLAGLDISA